VTPSSLRFLSPNYHQDGSTMSATQRVNLDKDKLKQQFDVSHFDINAILRGMQLTFVGGTGLLGCLLSK